MSRVAQSWFAALLLLVPTALVPQVPPELRSADALAARVEAAERSTTIDEGLDAALDVAAVDAELARVASYLRTHPDDAFALVLSVRLGRIRDLLALRDAYMAMYEDPEAGIPEPPSRQPHLAVLEQVLARDSTVADAHYWTARLLLEDLEQRLSGTLAPAPIPGTEAEVQRLALDHARRAVRFAPSQLPHREFLALLLVRENQLAEGTELLGHESTAGTLMHRLALDLLAFAPPAPAEPDEILDNFIQMTTMMGAGASEDPYLAQHLELRARGWSAEASMADVLAHYQRRWPGLKFLPAEAWEGAVMAAFVPEDGGWRPVVDDEELSALDRWDAESLTLLLVPSEVYHEMCEGALRHGLPPDRLPTGDRLGVLIMNGRRASH